jgi:hypothetical protein
MLYLRQETYNRKVTFFYWTLSLWVFIAPTLCTRSRQRRRRIVIFCPRRSWRAVNCSHALLHSATASVKETALWAWGGCLWRVAIHSCLAGNTSTVIASTAGIAVLYVGFLRKEECEHRRHIPELHFMSQLWNGSNLCIRNRNQLSSKLTISKSAPLLVFVKTGAFNKSKKSKAIPVTGLEGL